MRVCVCVFHTYITINYGIDINHHIRTLPDLAPAASPVNKQKPCTCQCLDLLVEGQLNINEDDTCDILVLHLSYINSAKTENSRYFHTAPS